MRNNITRNVILQKGETVQKDFKNLKAQNTYCAMMLTTKRLIVYTFGPETEKGRRIRRRKMDEIDIRSIHRFEYYLDYRRVSVFVRILGVLFCLGAAFAAYTNYTQQLGTWILAYTGFDIAPYWYYAFGACAVFAIIGVAMMFGNKKSLVLKIRSGLDDKLSLRFHPDKVNEEAFRFIAGKIHVD